MEIFTFHQKSLLSPSTSHSSLTLLSMSLDPLVHLGSSKIKDSKWTKYNYPNIPSNRDKVKDENDGEVVNEVV